MVCSGGPQLVFEGCLWLSLGRSRTDMLLQGVRVNERSLPLQRVPDVCGSIAVGGIGRSQSPRMKTRAHAKDRGGKALIDTLAQGLRMPVHHKAIRSDGLNQSGLSLSL
jgi:hypothetical protein